MHVIHGIFNVCVFLSPFVLFYIVVNKDETSSTTTERPIKISI